LEKVLIVLGSGGHTEQMIRLLDMLGGKYEYYYVVNNEDNISPHKIKFSGPIFKITLTRTKRSPFFETTQRTLKALYDALFIIHKTKCDVIISAGSAMSVPLFIVAKLYGMKTIFLESWSRITTKSNAGRLCYPLSDLFFIQWRELKALYPKAIYRGRLG
jgi:UDP-N-acetylglucosamine:LPS N-acetylglucosamine transferase